MKYFKNHKKLFIFIGIIIIILIISLAVLLNNKNNLNKTNNQNNINEDIKSQEKNETPNNKEIEIDNSKPSEKDENINKNPEKTDKDNYQNKPNTNNNPKPIENEKDNNKPNNEQPNNNQNNNNTDKKEEDIPNKSEVQLPPKEQTPEEKNDTKRKSIENNLGIKIAYSHEKETYHPRGITPTLLTDTTEINKYLNTLETELNKYPKGFFKDFVKKGMPLTIYLIKSANGSFSGFTDYQFMNDIKLTLVTDYNFEYTLHHEIMHYIDCYLEIVMYPNNPYTEYTTLNPKGFTYGNATTEQIYNMSKNPRGAYFISAYGSTHVKEDRAEIFKYMTARVYAPIGCFEPNEIIRKKAETISKQIKTYFPSVTGPAKWDQFIK